MRSASAEQLRAPRTARSPSHRAARRLQSLWLHTRRQDGSKPLLRHRVSAVALAGFQLLVMAAGQPPALSEAVIACEQTASPSPAFRALPLVAIRSNRVFFTRLHPEYCTHPRPSTVHNRMAMHCDLCHVCTWAMRHVARAAVLLCIRPSTPALRV